MRKHSMIGWKILSDLEKAKLILKRMKEAGYEETCDPEVAETWTDDEVDYFVVNYSSYLEGVKYE